MTSDRATHTNICGKSLSAQMQGTVSPKVSVTFSDIIVPLQSPLWTLSKHYELVTSFERALKGKHLNNKQGFCWEHRAFTTEVKFALIPVLPLHVQRNFDSQECLCVVLSQIHVYHSLNCNSEAKHLIFLGGLYLD